MLSQWSHKSSTQAESGSCLSPYGCLPWVWISCFQAEFCNGAEGSASDWALIGRVTVFFVRKIQLKKLKILKNLDCQKSKQKLCFTAIVFPWAALILLAIEHTLLYSLLWTSSQIKLTVCGLRIHIHPKSGMNKESRRPDIPVVDVKLSIGRISL